MTLMLVGINHKYAPIEIRENFSLEKNEMEIALSHILESQKVSEAMLLSTCNRTELYAFCEERHNLLDDFSLYFKNHKKVDVSQIKEEIFYKKEGEAAAQHLLRVACGLDSSIIGETQILGQVKEAFHLCQEKGATGTYLNKLGQMALSTGKKAHSKTAIGQHPVSFGYASAEIARRTFPSLKDQNLIVIGTGEMAELTLKNIFELGVKEVIVASNYPHRAEKLAAHFKGRNISLTEINKGLEWADVVICATNAPHYVITRKRLEPLLHEKRNNPLLVIDLGVPRNVEPEVGELKGVYLYNLDEINEIIQSNLETRQKEAEKVESIIEKEVCEYMYWYNHQHITPFISSLQEKAESIRQEKLEQFQGQLSTLSPEERDNVEKLTRSIINAMVKEPIINIKDLCSQEDKKLVEKYASQIFGLDNRK